MSRSVWTRLGPPAGLVLTLLLCGSCRAPQQTVSQDRPNIIFIMADDHAVRALSAYGSTLIDTPNLDRIGHGGILFRNSFVTNSICAPSRAVLLTGKYSHQNGLRDNRDRFDGDQVTFPKLLQAAGYQTSMIGKWHLKSTPTGLDHFRILIGQGDYYNPTFVTDTDTTRITGYVTDLITDFAIEQIESRDPDKPFAMLYHHKAPHRNWMPSPETMSLFNDRVFPLPDNFYDTYDGRQAAAEQDMEIADMFTAFDTKIHPRDGEVFLDSGGSGDEEYSLDDAWKAMYTSLTPEQKSRWDAQYDPVNLAFRTDNLSGDALTEWKYQRYMKDYLRVVASIDRNVGRLLDYLDETGLAENTVVVYTSDQGFYLGEHGWYDKRFIYEESFRTPLMIRYPRQIAPSQETEALVMNLDWAPTLLEFAGVSVPADMQGASLGPLTRGENPADWRSSMYYHYYEYPHGWHFVKRHYGVRTDRYKLIHFYDDIDTWEFYDLETDPGEMNNLYGNSRYETIVNDLKNEIFRLQRKYGDQSFLDDL